MKVCFSGRFDDIHLGHWATILKLTKVYDRVLVVILDYKGRQHSAQYIQNCLTTLITLSEIPSHKIEILINTTHFGELTAAEWDTLDCEHYAGGNDKVNQHIAGLGVPVYQAERSFDFSARNYKRKK